MSMNEALPTTCKNCMMPVLPKNGREGAGESDVSFLFASMHCICNAPRMQASENSQNTEFCKTCKKRKPSNASRVGSFTGFLFAATRCKCAGTQAKHAITLKDLHDLTAIIQPTKADRTRRGARTKMVQHNKTRRPSRTQALMANKNSRAMMSLQPGLEIGGTYQLQEHIGEGGMGSVYSARHMVLNRPCAIKFLMPDMVSESSWQMFKNEAKILNSLNHEGICKIYDLGLHQNALPFLAMELIDGITLDEYLTRFGPLSTGAALQLAAEAARTLAYAHRHNILHRDLKPGNIMLASTNNNNVTVKILDFGISQTMAHDENADLDDDDDIIGSAFYMSPEQFRGEKLTPASDIYSLGCTIFECLTGRPVYDAEEFQDLSDLHQNADTPTLQEVSGVPMAPELEAIISHCLQKNTLKRYKSMSELAVDCQKLLEGRKPQFAVDHATGTKNQKQTNTNFDWRLVAGLILGIVLCLGALAGMYHASVSKDFAVAKKQSSTDIQEGLSIGILAAANQNVANELAIRKPDMPDSATIERDKQVFLSQNAMLGKLIVKDGKRYWVFDFPQHFMACQLAFTDDRGATLIAQTYGTIQIPADRGLKLTIENGTPEIAQNLLRRLNPDCIEHLIIEDPQITNITPIARWTALKQLKLSRLTPTRATVDTIAQLTKLRYLALHQCQIDKDDLLRMLKGKTLRSINLTGTTVTPSLDVVLPEILANKHISELSIDRPNNDKTIEYIASMPQLRYVGLKSDKLDLQQAKHLCQTVKNKDLSLLCKELDFGYPEYLQLQKQYPRLKIKTTTSYAYQSLENETKRK